MLEFIKKYFTSRDELDSQVEYLTEKVHMLEKENFSLTAHIKVYENTLNFERERSKEMERIYLTRLGIIIPPRTVQSSTAPQTVNRGQTVHDLKAKMRQAESPAIIAQRKHWEEKLKAQESTDKVS